MSLVVLPVSLVLSGLAGCLTQGPTFSGVKAVSVKQYTSDGTVAIPLSTTQQQKAVSCLYKTSEVDESETEDLLLQDVYLIDVEDHSGIRTYELFTRSNFSNKGKFFRNACIYEIVGGAQRDLQAAEEPDADEE